MMNVDTAFEAAKTIFSTAMERIEGVRSEEDAKVRIITRILTEALGWDHQDISSEHPNENGFSDYVLSDREHAYFVLEAKKLGEIQVATESTAQGTYKVSGPVLKPALAGISQAASYCHPLGIPLAVLTDGIRWIVFLPWVPHANYREKQAVVFPNSQAILESFSLFYELLAKTECQKSTFRVIFDRLNENRLVLDSPLIAPITGSENSIVQKSALAFDLDRVFSSFFAGLTGEDDPDMIIDCFVETKESRVADFALERITKNVLGNLESHEGGVGEGLRTIVQDALAGEPGQTVFIVGPSGAGKSTFLDRFFKRTLSPEIRGHCIVVHVNSLDASGDERSALHWMTERSIKCLEEQLFSAGFPVWADLQALYHLEYIKRSKGVDALLYQRDKPAFKEKFARFVEEQVESDREGYLRKLLANVVKNRKKLPIFVVDNTDEFSLEFKSAVFQYFQALRRYVGHCLLLFPATDRSAWTFSKTEIFNIYSSRSFFLPTPSPREVFRKRVEYLKTKISTGPEDQQAREYLAGRGIRVQIKDLDAFARVVENVFVEQDYASRRVGELSNYNMRKALGLSKRVITSSVLKIDDLVRSYLTGAMVAPTPERFMNALLKGDYEFYKPGDEPLIFPLYQVDSAVRQSPLIHLRVLVLLQGLDDAASDDEDRYITVASLTSYFDVMSISEVALQRSLDALLAAGLVEPYDLSRKDYSADQKVAISDSGLLHLNMAIFNPVYFEQMALTTRIPNPEVAAAIRGAFGAPKILNARLEEVRRIFGQYIVQEDGSYCHVPETPEYRAQKELTLELSHRWSTGSTGDLAEFPEKAREGVRGTVERFDRSRGFGFVEIPALRDSAFLHISTLERDGFTEVNDGDDIVCDLAQNEKGLVVSKIRELSTSEGPLLQAQVIKVFEERGYGFVYIPETGAEAFFHFHLLTTRQKEDLFEGSELLVDVTTDKEGRSQVKRIADPANIARLKPA